MKNLLPQNPGDTIVNPPLHFHRFRIILESGDTIVNPHTNQEPTLLLYTYILFYDSLLYTYNIL
jgi:hypothetical protein